MKNKIFPFRGSVLLRVAVVVLVLAILAQLTLILVRRKDRQDGDSSQAVAAYYAADYQAEQIYDQLRRGAMPEGVTRQGTIYTYQCPISEEEDLLVVLEKTGDDWQVLRWQPILRQTGN